AEPGADVARLARERPHALHALLRRLPRQGRPRRRPGLDDEPAAGAIRRRAADRGSREHREDPQRRTHLCDDPLRAPPHAFLPAHPRGGPLGHHQLRPISERPEGSRAVSAEAPRLVANPGRLPGSLVALCVALMAAGAAAFALGLSSDPATAWRAFHVNFLYFGNIAQAAVVVACSLVIIGARWAGPIRHVAE